MELKALVEDFVSQRVPMLIKCNVVRSYTNLTIWGFFLCLETIVAYMHCRSCTSLVKDNGP